jgi:SecD/SecF fusion protein
MEKQKRWQLFLIIAVVILTIYNILPTVFYYSKPLKAPINNTRADTIAEEIVSRTNHLEKDSVEWLDSFCKQLNLKPLSVAFDRQSPQFVNVTFKNSEDANKFKSYLPRAGALIVFAPSQLSLYDSSNDNPAKTVTVQRRVPVHFDPSKINSYFQFSPKVDADGNIADLYRALINDRALQIGNALGGVSENAQYATAAIAHSKDQQSQDAILFLSQNILSFANAFGEDSAITQRYFASFSQADVDNHRQFIQNFLDSIEGTKDKVKLERISLEQEAANLQSQSSFLDTAKQQRLELLLNHEKTLASAEAMIKKNVQAFASASTPFSYTSLGGILQETGLRINPDEKLQIIPIGNRNPFIDTMVIDWGNEKIYLQLHADFADFRQKLDEDKRFSYQKDQSDQFLYNEIAYIARQSGETITPFQNEFSITLNQLPNSKSFLTMRLGSIAKAEIDQLKQTLLKNWAPKHPDLAREAFPIWDYETYISLPLEQQKLGLVLYAPASYNKMPLTGFRMNSVYVIAKGLDKILLKYKNVPDSEQAKQFMQDFSSLREIMQHNGLFGYRGAAYQFSADYANDFIFEGEDYFNTVLKATREDFTVRGTKRYAVLEFSDVEQRILTENKIETHMHEDLLKWRDDYKAAQMNIRGISSYDVPAPTKNVLWDNFKLSLVKYFRGDDRKILHWGLDLSGGKTVQIELRDHNNRPVTSEIDIKQGINELYNRVNKMGVSEVSIRQEGNYITLDFPGSQDLSAAELIKASSMYFHVVNEKFTPGNPQLAETANRFLQEVWNEAVVTNRKDADSVNLIAFKHLYGESLEANVVQPRSEAAKTLYDNGLRLANPTDTSATNTFNDSSSKVALFRGEDFTDWQGQTHPLLIVFRNYALEGASLENVQASYDPSKGNFLSFGISGSRATKEGVKFNARDDLYAWTSQFSKEKIDGTPLEAFSRGKGWRMAVILNGTIISSPTLDSALRDSAMITGSFTQREINQLEADLKAGSLSFTPRILSEKNVSPELGSHEKSLGIVATIVALALVISAMVLYYRFGGLVASIAVIFNLLIIWATLQNLHATLTLASIAGLILTVGTAVDANVLVFERIREEFAATGRIASAVHAGYRKAFSAIIDSNLTTIIAALILLHFDSGPIKAFAITLIIGIISSMFTALFLTRYFFAGWVQNPKNKVLKMANLIKSTHFNFLKYTKATILFSTVVILLGGYLLISQRHTMLGMDFTGGYAVNIELQAHQGMNYRQAVEKALIKEGATNQDFQIRELTPSNNIRLFLSKSLNQPGHPFYGMAHQTDAKDVGYGYEANPKLAWIVQTIEKSGLVITPQSLQHLEANWTEISGQMSDTMRNNAMIGLCVALLCILIYITARFEFKYAISATICLAHDILFTVAAMAILHFLKVPIQIDLNTVAALMTIVGYSLNDTIIVFDRIREDIRLMRKSSFGEIINHALNITLSRTTMTSGTTLLVLIPLIALGGSTIFGFALVMAIGVIFGTLSSLFIAAPLMQYFHSKELQKETKTIQSKGKEFII